MTCVQLALIFVFSNSVEVFFKDSLIFKSLVTIKLLFFQTCVMISFNIIVCSVIVSCTTLRVFKVSLGSKIGFLFSWEKSSSNFNEKPTHPWTVLNLTKQFAFKGWVCWESRLALVKWDKYDGNYCFVFCWPGSFCISAYGVGSAGQVR